MLEGLPSLEELYCLCNPFLAGNVNSLRVLRDSLQKVQILGSSNIRGNFMDLADFPHLRELSLYYTEVTGDIRDISGSDFPALESIRLPKTVAGGVDYGFQSISEVPSFMHAIHLLLQRTQPRLRFDSETLSNAFNWKLSGDSPDWYEIELRTLIISFLSGCPAPPFILQIIQAGKRLGWSWCAGCHSCEINWLDPVPSTDSDDFETYMEEFQRFVERNKFGFYRGYHQPPNEQQYSRLREDFEAIQRMG